MSAEDTKETTSYADRDISGFHSFYEDILNILLKDRTTDKNIIWATDDYASYNPAYTFKEQIHSEDILSVDGGLVRPRVKKTYEKRHARVHDMAEVFTPSWICNEQNNLIDEAWFGYKNVFNTKTDYSWNTKVDPIVFPNTPGKDWMSYVTDNRLEIACGEAPYLVSRYDATSGVEIPLKDRIGLLDRKLRVINENISKEDKLGWRKWVTKAYKATYGYEWQGDNTLIARENLLYTLTDYYKDKFGEMPSIDLIREIAYIISWNIWQMDGIKCVIPNSCTTQIIEMPRLDGTVDICINECAGCKDDNIRNHNGIYSTIMDWTNSKPIKYVDLIKEKVKLYTSKMSLF